jgi:hypothetical protein
MANVAEPMKIKGLTVGSVAVEDVMHFTGGLAELHRQLARLAHFAVGLAPYLVEPPAFVAE